MENVSVIPEQVSGDILSIRAQADLDLDDIGPYLLHNDAGGHTIYQRKGEAFFRQSLANAHARIRQAGSEAECSAIIAYHLRDWRTAHLYVAETGVDAEPSVTSFCTHELPSLHDLSGRTLHLRLPDFNESARQPILDLLQAHYERLLACPNWIIDVRGNGGEMDRCYYPLLPWLLTNDTTEMANSVLATAENLANQRQMFKQVCDTLPEPDQDWLQLLDTMAQTRPGTRFLEPGHEAFSFVHARRYAAYSPFPRHLPPHRVAVLIDGGCASACERFLLTVRQSFNIKLIGQPTFGEADYTSLTPHRLPSGTRTLYYSVGSSLRAPAFEIDPCGVAPDIYVPTTFTQANSGQYLQKVWNWLESGHF